MAVERFGIRDTRDTGYEGYEGSGIRDTERVFRVTGYEGYGLPNNNFHGYGIRVTGCRTTIFMVTGYGLPKGYHHNLHANPGVRVDSRVDDCTTLGE